MSYDKVERANFIYKIDALITRIEEKEKEVDNLKCCGNCKYYRVFNIDSFCDIDGNPVNPHKRCTVDHWQSDGMTAEGRKG